MTWSPCVFMDDDGSQVLVNVNEDGLMHVATRNRVGDSWGPPLPCVEDTRNRPQPVAERICPRCKQRPIISTLHQECATCIVNGLAGRPGYAEQMDEQAYEAFASGNAK